MAFFGVLFFANRRAAVACLPIPILIGFSRIYIGAHYLSDVVCGVILGILSAVLVARLLFRWPFRPLLERRERKNQPPRGET
ncbi:MAG: hypothetical protein DMG96_28135 [Acidobacteria bacterium]|nr:MAG: hypothetical protein DMG96_28135 [Acidobacteriota bacterium]